MPAGTEAYDVVASGGVGFQAPPTFELAVDQPSEAHPKDNPNPLVFGSAASYATLGSAAARSAGSGVTSWAKEIAQDPGLYDPQHVPDLSPRAGQIPGVGGSAASIARLLARPQYTSAQVYAIDRDISNLDPGLALPYGNNEFGANGVAGTVVTASGVVSYSSGWLNPLSDPGLFNVPLQPLPYGTNDSIVNQKPVAASGNAAPSGAPPVRDFNVQALNPAQALSAGTNDPLVPNTQPTAPKASTYQASGQVVKVTFGEAGAVTPRPPTTQYGTSAP